MVEKVTAYKVGDELYINKRVAYENELAKELKQMFQGRDASGILRHIVYNIDVRVHLVELISNYELNLKQCED